MNISTELSIVPQQIAIRPKNEIDASVPVYIIVHLILYRGFSKLTIINAPSGIEVL